jgi:hypothetical protein
VAPLGKHEIKQSDREDISNMNSAYLVLKFTLWCAEVATTIINTSQPPPPVSKLEAPPRVGMDLAIAQLVPTQEAPKLAHLLLMQDSCQHERPPELAQILHRQNSCQHRELKLVNIYVATSV